MKSLLPQAFAVSNVHPRLRKRLARCTLDCGFKTSESPALRGFVAERGPIRGTSLYLAFFFVLEKAVKSAGNAVIPTFPMHRSHGLQGSLKRRYKHPSPTSINGYHTAKKLLSQSPAKRPTFAFADESGYTLAFANRIAHSGLHAETGAVSDGGAITTLGAFCAVRKPCVARCQNGVLCRFGILAGRCSRRTQKTFGTAMRLCVSLSRRRRGPAGLRNPVSALLIM